MLKLFAGGTVLALALGASASAETIAVCGTQDGRAYYAERGIVPKGSGGWRDDPISKGKTTLTRQANGDLDILYGDATGAVYSARAEGAQVVRARQGPGELSLIVAYPGATVEVYSFLKVGSGGQLLMTQSRGGEMITKVGIYASKCELGSAF